MPPVLTPQWMRLYAVIYMVLWGPQQDGASAAHGNSSCPGESPSLRVAFWGSQPKAEPIHL